MDFVFFFIVSICRGWKGWIKKWFSLSTFSYILFVLCCDFEKYFLEKGWEGAKKISFSIFCHHIYSKLKVPPGPFAALKPKPGWDYDFS